MTLDTFARKVGVDPYLLKIDVETHEPAVLRGALQTIERARPWIVCEILRSGDYQAVQRVLRSLDDLGYQFRPLTDRFPWPTARSDDVDLMTGLGARDWLFAPEPVTDDITVAVGQWLAAIERCGPDTNRLVEAGTPLPAGWNVSPRQLSAGRGWRDRIPGRRLVRAPIVYRSSSSTTASAR
jgi:hypothetical protein